MTTIHIIGAGGHGRVVADVIESMCSDWQIAWYDDAWRSMPVLPPVHSVRSPDEIWESSQKQMAFVAVGRSDVRIPILERLHSLGHDVCTLVHRAAVVSPYAVLGRGTVVMAGAVVQTGANLGVGVIVNTSSSVDHDCQIADGVHIAPGAHLAGDVTVGPSSWIGAGSVVREGIKIGARVVVGAGAVVVSDLEDGAVVVGNPGRSMAAAKKEVSTR